MFEKFTEGAIRVVMGGQEEAKRMGHNHVGTEQLMLGMIAQRRGIAGMALYLEGIRLKPFRREVEKHTGRGRGFIGDEIPFTPRAKRVLEMSISEAKDLGLNYVGSEHILLAVLSEGGGVAVQILDKFKIDYVKLRRWIFTFIEEVEEYGGQVITQDRSVLPPSVKRKFDEWKKT